MTNRPTALLAPDFKDLTVAPETTLRELLIALDRLDSDAAFVVTPELTLLGVITDGDVRRALLKKLDLFSPVTEIMSRKPFTTQPGLEAAAYVEQLQRHRVRHLPVVDSSGKLLDIAILERLAPSPTSPSHAVIMAGGLGTRMGDLTKSVPKPLLKIKDEPILGHILASLSKHGITRAHLCVNHLAEKIEEYVGDGKRWGIEASYIREKERMGTAGALGLLPAEVVREAHELQAPLIVMNGDILTQVRFVNLLAYHQVYRYDITVCASQYDIQVPFGVIEAQGAQIQAIREKPVQNFLINAGIYVLSPAVLDLIPQGKRSDMPEIIQRAIDKGMNVGCFPIREYWIDVGTPGDYSKANTVSKF